MSDGSIGSVRSGGAVAHPKAVPSAKAPAKAGPSVVPSGPVSPERLPDELKGAAKAGKAAPHQSFDDPFVGMDMGYIDPSDTNAKGNGRLSLGNDHEKFLVTAGGRAVYCTEDGEMQDRAGKVISPTALDAIDRSAKKPQTRLAKMVGNIALSNAVPVTLGAVTHAWAAAMRKDAGSKGMRIGAGVQGALDVYFLQKSVRATVAHAKAGDASYRVGDAMQVGGNLVKLAGTSMSLSKSPATFVAGVATHFVGAMMSLAGTNVEERTKHKTK